MIRPVSRFFETKSSDNDNDKLFYILIYMKIFYFIFFFTFSKLVKRDKDNENDKIMSKFYTEPYRMKKRAFCCCSRSHFYYLYRA